VFVALDGNIAGALAVADLSRQRRRTPIRRLRAMGLKIVMLTG